MIRLLAWLAVACLAGLSLPAAADDPHVAPGTAEVFHARHRDLLDAHPDPPVSFLLHFRFDSMELTPESRRMLPQVLEAVRRRLPTEVTVFGYADATGNRRDYRHRSARFRDDEDATPYASSVAGHGFTRVRAG